MLSTMATLSTIPTILLLLCIFLSHTVAFVVPTSIISSIQASTSAFDVLPPTPFLVANADITSDLFATSLAAPLPLSSSYISTLSIAEGGIGDALVTIVSVIAIVVFGFGALTLVMANIIIPKAAEELEAKARKEYPELWRATEAKLEEGEVLATRPDLIQDLGRLVQEGDMEKFQAMAEEEENKSESSSNVVDVEIITETKDENK